MERLSLTDARAQLPQLLDRVTAGESFAITRHGAAVAVLTGHDEWMKIKTHDVILQARELGRRLDTARGKPIDLSGPPTDRENVDAAITDLEWSKGERDYHDHRGL